MAGAFGSCYEAGTQARDIIFGKIRRNRERTEELTANCIPYGRCCQRHDASGFGKPLLWTERRDCKRNGPCRGSGALEGGVLPVRSICQVMVWRS